MTTYVESAVDYGRQSAILNPDDAARTSISILGCGTVGSWSAECLANAGFKKFFLCDMDTVEDVNLPSQAFGLSDIGEPKVEMTKKNIERVTDGHSIRTQNWALEGYEQFDTGVILSAVDNMEIRKGIFENGAKGKADSLFIDFRMGGNLLKVWAFDTLDERRCRQYADTLHSTESASELPCGGRTFSPVGPLAGAIATQLVTKWLRDGDAPPFHIQMDFDRFQSRAIGLVEMED